jgi:hypothetical protein
LTRFLEPFLLRLLGLPVPRLFLRALLLRAFRRCAPECFSGVVPALLAQVPRARQVCAASPALALDASRPHHHEHSAGRNGRHGQNRERRANPRAI